MIERRLLSSLTEWKNSKSRKPLILRGAHQVGKSTLINEFAKEYDVYLKLIFFTSFATGLYPAP